MAEVALSTAKYDAVIFDLDGVITDTARVHQRAWRELFDAYLARREGRTAPSRPFTDDDYRRYVDGRPRYDGVKTFLSSRGIELPYGDPSDPPGDGTICALGNRKNALFQQYLAEGIEPYPTSVTLVEALRDLGMRTAIVSSSRNTVAVLQAAGVQDLFDVKVDGVDAGARGLPGKPDPAFFLAAAEELGVQPARAVVIEDATAGVEAGRRGGFGLVIGVDRTGDPQRLRDHGADVVVDDLGKVSVEGA